VNDGWWGDKQFGASTETTAILPEILVQPNYSRENWVQLMARM
jgi:hypothetical protein